MKAPLDTLPYRSLKQILASKATGVLSVAPDASVLSAIEMMATRHVGFLVVLENGRLAGVLSERDYARKVALAGRSSKDTLVREIMVREVVSAKPDDTVPQCMTVMDQRGFRHLPVVEHGQVIGVLSIRDLLKEVIVHHERIIAELDRDRLTILNAYA